jgi:hypothetical protein
MKSKKTATAQHCSTMGFGNAKATAAGILPEFSKFYCHPGKAGETPGILASEIHI